jgi:phenylpropionate dioxygenase-like ring-hydroxylating dioxygenase large terminal subunit
MGEDLVVYRTRAGVVRAVEPYCPHLGAHLGYGGWIDGEKIVCPFHHYAFDPSGACVRTGYGTRPPVARLTHREVREINGAILVWHHAAGSPPAWEVPAHSMEGFPAPFRHCTTLVDHPQDVVENAIDTGHIGPVHNYLNARVRQPFSTDGSSFTIAASGDRVFPLIGPTEIAFDIVVHGLGHIWVEATIPRLRAAARWQAMATPIDPRRVAFRFGVALRVGGSDRSVARARLLLSWLLTHGLGPAFRHDLRQDFPIWEHKVYVERPRLAQGDGPIAAYRRWAAQFYTAAGANGRPVATPLSAGR